jgi:hypothetical protein
MAGCRRELPATSCGMSAGWAVAGTGKESGCCAGIGLPSPRAQTAHSIGLLHSTGKLHRDAESASGPGGEGEGSVVCLGDALDDC